MASRWTPALAVGVDEIDEQHRELFRRVDDLEDAIVARDDQGALRMLRFLEEYVRVHFAAEEGLMAALRYPALGGHRTQHAAFNTAVQSIARALDRDGATAALVLQLEREVTSWLRDHVFTADVAFGKFVQGQPLAALTRE
jgi:hemerythrin